MVVVTVVAVAVVVAVVAVDVVCVCATVGRRVPRANQQRGLLNSRCRSIDVEELC